MKVLLVLLGIIIASLQTGAAVEVTIRAYNATGMVDIVADDINKKVTFTLGTRVLLTCDVRGLPVGIVAENYTWYHNCIGSDCEILEGDPYYTVVNDTLLVDVISMENVGMYHCHVMHAMQGISHSVEYRKFTTRIALAGTPAAFLFTPTSLLLENSLITDIQQTAGWDQQRWIKCTTGVNGEPLIHGNVPNPPRTSTAGQTATLMLNPQTLPPNGPYYCMAKMKRYNFAMFLRNQSTLSTPIEGLNTGEWTIAPPDSNRVERYIVAFECSVRNITFVEKYMNVSGSGGTGRVAISASCFGELGQLYRLKVWAVSGPNISRQPAVKCLTPDGNCKREGIRGKPIPTTVDTTSAITNLSPSIQIGPQDEPSQIGTFIGVGAGVGVFLLLVLMAVAIILIVLVVRRKTAYKLKGAKTMEDNLHYNKTVVLKREREMEAEDLGADYDDVGNDKGEDRGSIVDGFDPYDDVDSKAEIKITMTPISKESPSPFKATNIDEMYAVVDMSKKKGANKEREFEDELAITSKNDLYAMPMGKIANRRDGVGDCSGTVEGEENDFTAGLKYEPKANSEPGQRSDGVSMALDVDMLYSVVDKSRKKKK